MFDEVIKNPHIIRILNYHPVKNWLRVYYVICAYGAKSILKFHPQEISDIDKLEKLAYDFLDESEIEALSKKTKNELGKFSEELRSVKEYLSQLDKKVQTHFIENKEKNKHKSYNKKLNEKETRVYNTSRENENELIRKFSNNLKSLGRNDQTMKTTNNNFPYKSGFDKANRYLDKGISSSSNLKSPLKESVVYNKERDKIIYENNKPVGKESIIIQRLLKNTTKNLTFNNSVDRIEYNKNIQSENTDSSVLQMTDRLLSSMIASHFSKENSPIDSTKKIYNKRRPMYKPVKGRNYK